MDNKSFPQNRIAPTKFQVKEFTALVLWLSIHPQPHIKSANKIIVNFKPLRFVLQTPVLDGQ